MLWMKKFRNKKMQSLLILIVVALCTTLISGSVIILTSLSSVYEELKQDTNAPDFKIYARAGYYKSYSEAIEKCSSVKKNVEISKRTITSIYHNGKEEDVFVDIVKYTSDIYENVRNIKGNVKKPDKGECIIPAVIANKLNLDVGDKLQLSVDGTKYEYTISGIYSEIYSACIEYTCDILVSQLPCEPDDTNIYAVWLNEGYSNDDFIREYTEQNNGIMNGYFRSAKDCVLNAELTELILGGILLSISAVVFIAILVIIGFIVKSCFKNDKESIAIYKTFGYKQGQIRRLYVTFYMSIIGLGAIIGTLTSPLLSNAFIKDVYKNVGIGGGLRNVWQMVISCIVICGVSFVMLETKSRNITKMKPVNILTGADNQLGRKKYKQTRFNKNNFSAANMAMRMFSRDRKNTLLLIVICVVSIYIVNISVVCIQNLKLIKGENNYYWLGIDKHDITLENNTTQDEFYDICSQVGKDDEVVDAIKKNYDCGFAIPYHQTTSALIYETFDGLELPVIKGRNPQNTDEIAVGNLYLKDLGIDIGDYITIQLDEKNRKDFLIVGTFQGFYNLGKSIRLMGGILEDNNVPFEYNQCSIMLKKGTDIDKYIDQLNEKYEGKIKVIKRTNLYENIMDSVCEPQRKALLPFTVITILIGAVNAFYIMYTSNIEKRKKYTIYKALGYTSSHLLKMNCIYIGTVALIAIAVAVPLFIFLFPKVMVLSMSVFGFAEYKLTIKPLTIIIINSSMFAVFMGSILATSKELFKNHIAKIMNE